MENENKDVTEETKKENKEEIKETTKEETKEATKEETKETKETTKEAIKEETKPEVKEETKEETNDKPKKSKKGLWIGLGILVVLLLAYGVVAFYYHSHFLYQTSVNDTDCSNLTAVEVAAIMDSQSQQYSLQIFGRDENGVQEEIGTVTAPEIGMNWVDTQGAAQELLNIQNEFLWIEMLWSTQNYDMVQGVAYDADKLQEQLAQMPALQKKNMIQPEDAYISEYSEKTKSYEIVPETLGSTLDMNQVEDVISAAIMAGDTSVDLEEQGCYATAKVTAEDTALVKACDTMNKWVSAQITYDWNGNKVVVDGDAIHEWIQADDKDPQLDEKAIAEFVSEQAKEYDTYGKKRKFTTVQGIELNLPSGAYGWKTDREEETKALIEAIQNGETVDKEPVYISKGAQKGSNDIGNSYVEIDLTNQHLYLFKDGDIVLETDFVSGNMSKADCVTPPGVFGLTYKTRNAILRGANYETPVNYWMPFNGNIGMHDATWRRAFGGTIYLTSGSHGCINLPLHMAASIYEYVSTGFPVVCYYY